MVVEITQEDIELSGDGCRNCPIALSLERLGYPCSVCFKGIVVDGYPNMFDIPGEAKEFIVRHTFKKKLTPFSFELNIW